MSQILLVVGGLLWFGYAGIGLGFLLEAPMRLPVERAMRALRADDGLVGPSEVELARWTQRWSRIVGFLAFFGTLGVFSVIAPEVGTHTLALTVFGGVVPAVGYWRRWRARSGPGT